MDARRADLLAALLTGRLTPTTDPTPRRRHASAAAGAPGQTPGAGGDAVHHPARRRPAALRAGRARPDHRRARPRDRRRRHPRAPGLRPALRHPARPRPHHLPAPGRAGRPRPRPRRALPAADLPPPRRRQRTRPPDPVPDGPTSEANLATGCSHDHHLKHSPGWQVHALPTAGSSGSPPPGTATAAPPTTTATTTTRSPRSGRPGPHPTSRTPQHHDPATIPRPFDLRFQTGAPSVREIASAARATRGPISSGPRLAGSLVSCETLTAPTTRPVWSTTAAPTQRTPASFSSSSTDQPRSRTSCRCATSAAGSVNVRGVRASRAHAGEQRPHLRLAAARRARPCRSPCSAAASPSPLATPSGTACCPRPWRRRRPRRRRASRGARCRRTRSCSAVSSGRARSAASVRASTRPARPRMRAPPW